MKYKKKLGEKMKKKILFIIIFLVLLSMSIGNITKAYSNENTLYYDGNKKELIYFNKKDKEVFDQFKNLMPGDEKEQEIIIEANNINTKTDLYLKITEKFAFSEYLDIKLYKNNKELTNLEGKTGIIKIHTFNKDEKITLKLKVTIKEELGNEIEDKKSNFKWTFMVQEKELIDVPYTYDSSNLLINLIILFLSLIAIVIILFDLITRKRLN